MIGRTAGAGANTGANSIAIGAAAGGGVALQHQANAISIGTASGGNAQANTINIGISTGLSAGNSSINLGTSAGSLAGNNSISIGTTASSKDNAIAIGLNTTANANSISIGSNIVAGNSTNTIIISALGTNLSPNTNNATFITPLRNNVASNTIFYNPSTYEVIYGQANTLFDTSNVNARLNVNTGIMNYYSNTNATIMTVREEGFDITRPLGITIDNNGTQGILARTFNNANLQVAGWTSWRYRGNIASPANVQAGDEVGKFNFVIYADNGNVFTNSSEILASVVDNNGANSSGSFTLRTYGSNGFVQMYSPQTQFTNNGTANATIYGNGYISTNNRIEYLRTYGDFYSNATQTNPVANTVNLMTFNNTGSANGISIVSNSQITITRTGIYNIAFSAQLEHDVNQTANVEIWLKKNGNNVADTNTIVTVGKDQKTVAAWNWLANAGTSNDYFELAWASSDTAVELVSVPAANTIANVNIPSVILTVTPVGA